MFFHKLLRYVVANNSFYARNVIKNQACSLHFTNNVLQTKSDKDLLVYRSFENAKEKNKNTYLEMVHIFINRDHIHRRGHVEFIYAALKNMKSFGVHKDLEVYKSLIDVLPKGKFVPQNIFQAEFMHYPKQQQCIVDLLEQMEDNGVMPDYEMEDTLLAIFGKRGIPLRKFWRMMYWMPKFKNLSPWPLPDPLPNDVFELAKLAISRISSVDVQTKVTVYETAHIKDSIDETWIVSAQSPRQKELLRCHDVKHPVYVEGPSKVWIKDKAVDYFVLRSNVVNTADEEVIDMDDVSNISVPLMGTTLPTTQYTQRSVPSVHEQEDGVIFGVCATGTSSKDSLLSWIRHLENDDNSCLATLTVVFTLKSGTKELANVETSTDVKRNEAKTEDN